MSKVLVIGLDGATFSLIKPWVQAGKLPNLAKLMAEGSYGDLQSVIHPISQHAWTSFMTGKNAGKHGIYDFYARKIGSYDFQYTAGTMRGSNTIFQILSSLGKKVGGFNIPMTFPVDKVNGFMIAGLGTPGKHSDFVYPPELKEKLFARAGDYKLLDVDRSLSDPETYINYQHETVAQSLELAKFLLDEFEIDLFMLVFMATDQMQHVFWHCMDKGHPSFDIKEHEKYGGVILDLYQKLDSAIGDLLSYVKDEYNVIIMSDHGFGPTNKVVYLHKWLEKNGLLTFKTTSTFVNPIKRTVVNLRRKAMQNLPRVWKNEIKRFFPSLVNKLDSYITFNNIDWSQTKAFPWGCYGNIVINLQGREPEGIVKSGEEFAALCDFIIQELSDLRDPDTNERVVERVYRKEELFHGNLVGWAPDLIVVFKDYNYYSVPSLRLDPRKHIFEKSLGAHETTKTLRALSHHRQNGICLFQGKDIIPGQEITQANIIDLAPTILYLMDLPIPADMDGRILTELFDGQRLVTHPIQYTDDQGEREIAREIPFTEDDKKAIEARLKGLGYLE